METQAVEPECTNCHAHGGQPCTEYCPGNTRTLDSFGVGGHDGSTPNPLAEEENDTATDGVPGASAGR